MILYHGTSEDANKIRARGLVGDTNLHNAVFLTDNPELAMEYAITDQYRTGLDNLVIVSVNSESLDQLKLYGDIDHTNIDDWIESLKKTDQCVYLGNIPPHILTIEEFNEEG